MQNWNQWQLPAATAAAPMPQPPISYAAPGADPMATMQAYMQYYNQPAPSGYTAEQWSVAQQQNWVQWQTWQQQYQQWQAQYGEKYQETMKQMSSQGLPGLAQVPTMAPIVQPPPLPKEDTSVKPPLPPDTGAYGTFTGVPPPHQNNLPLFPSKQSGKPPLPPGQPPLPPDVTSESSTNDANLSGKRGPSSNVDTGSAKKLKIEDDELTEAEKSFDDQFKKWEEKFNKWKQQNVNHPDKTQYKQYEAKWTSWREKLIERREQMRRKREQQRQAAAKAEADKNKSMSGGDKILNMLSSTENQGLINNLLGIGKTLGLTGKQETPVPPPVEPPHVSTAPQETTQPMGPPTMTANMNQAAWAAQQWAAQYNAGISMPTFNTGYQQPGPIPPVAVNNVMPSMPPTNFTQPPGNFNQPLGNVNNLPGPFNQPPGNFNQQPGNFNQPPPGMSVGVPTNMSNAPPNISTSGPNFSQPPPSFGTSDNSRQPFSQEQRNTQDSNSRSFNNDRDQRQGGPFSSRDSVGSGNDRFGFDGNRFNGPPPSNERFGNNRGGQFGSDENSGRDSHNKDFGSSNQSSNDNFRRDGNTRDFNPSGGNFDNRGNNNDSDCFGSGYDKDQEDPFDDGEGNNKFDSGRDTFNNDRFNNTGDRFATNNDRFSSGNDRFGSGNNRFSFGNDRSGQDNQSRSSGDRFGPPNDRFSGDKFASGDRGSSTNDRAGQSNDTRFNRPPPDRFDMHDSSRDSFGSATKSFGTNNQFKPADDMPPELKKLMEKRRAAMDVFKPSSFGSFLDSDKKSSSASSSLSESFRKITGDSPFLSRTSNDFGNRDKSPSKGPPPGMGGSGNFDTSRDFRPGDNANLNFRGPGDFGSRGSGDSSFRGLGAFPNRGNESGPRGFDAPPGFPRRSGDDAPRSGNEFGSRIRNDNEPSRNDNQQKDNFGSRVNRDSTPDKSDKMLPPSMRDCKSPRIAEDRKQPNAVPKDFKPGDSIKPNIPPLSMPPWMDPDFDDDVVVIPADKLPEPANLPFSRANKDNSKDASDSASVNPKESEDTPEGSQKKSDALPFMGENDPKPEDLNMEPPPEFPNLGPVIKGPPDLPFEQREGTTSGPFGLSTVDVDSRPPFNASFEPRGMQSGPRGPLMPPFVPGGPNNPRFAPFGPRGMAGSPDNKGPRGPFGPHASNSGGFGPRGPQDERFNPGESSMENFGPQSGNFGPRGPNDCNPRQGNFGPCGPDNFGPGGPNDFGSGGPNNFGPGGPNNFGPGGPNNFGPGGPNNFGPGGPNNFGPGGSNNFGPGGPNNFGPGGPNNSGPGGPSNFGPGGPNNFGPDGPNNFGPGGANNFGRDGPNNFGPGGPNNSGPGGPNNFGPGGPNNFGPGGPNNFGPDGPNNFGPGGPNNFGPDGPNNFGPGGANNFDRDGPNNFGPGGPNNFGPGGPNNFGPGGPNDFGPGRSNAFREGGPGNFGAGGPPNFGPRGPGNFQARGPSDFGNRGPDFQAGDPSDSQFGPRPFGSRGSLDQPFGPGASNNAPFGQRGPNNAPFGPRGPNDMPFRPQAPNDGPNAPFAPRPPFAPGSFAPRGNFDGPQPAIPSLMSFKFDRPIVQNDPSRENDKDDRSQDPAPASSAGDRDKRPFGGNKTQGDTERTSKQMESGKPSCGSGGPEWRKPSTRNKFGDFNQRTGSDVNNEGLSDDEIMEIDRVEVSGDLPDRRPLQGSSNIKSKDKKNPGIDSKPDFEKNRGSADSMPTRNDERRGIRGGQKVFCIEKQFNYNHSGGVPDEIMTEHKPAKVIDYAHAARTVVDDYVTPAQSFDYDHGSNKPNPPDHEARSIKDFRNWEENEHNLKEYADRMRNYESDSVTLNRGYLVRHTETPIQMREPSWIQEERRSYDRDRRSRSERASRRDTDNFRDKEKENRDRVRLEREREWERISNKHREDRAHHRRSDSRDRARERTEKIRQESNKENNKDDERSKGNVSGQESSAKNPTETTTKDNSREENRNAERDGSPKTMEVSEPGEPPKTMELPKTPNFTMIDDLLCNPGRQNRPPKIVVILRGPPGSGKSFVAKLIKDKEVEQGGSAPRILSLDDYFLTEKEIETVDDNGKKITTKNLVYEYEEAMESSYIGSLVKAFKKNITDGFFNFIILDSINEKILDYEEMWSFAKTKGFRVYVCEMEMDVQICFKRNSHKRTEEEVNRIVDYFEPTPNHHQKLDVTSMLQEEAIEEVHMEDSEEAEIIEIPGNDDSQDSREDQDSAVVSKWEKMEADDKLDRLDGLAKRKNEGKPQTMEDFLQVPDYYNMEDTSGKKRVRWADLEERKEQEKMRAVGFVVGQTNWDRMMDPTKGGSALTRTKYI